MPLAPPPPSAKLYWAHGTAGMPQTTQGFLVERVGYYLRLKAERSGDIWVHYPVATAVPVGSQLVLRGVRVQFRTFGGAELGRVHVWDGPRQVISHDEVRAVSDHGRAVRAGDQPEPFGVLQLDIEPAPVDAGISVSLLVRAQRKLDAVALSGVGVIVSEAAEPPTSPAPRKQARRP
jgi:hypothetical protein